MDAGFGEAALMGALVGGGASLLTGKNPLTGALMGGLSGGVMSGISGALANTGVNSAVENQIVSGAAENGVNPSTFLDSAGNAVKSLDTSIVDQGGVLSANPQIAGQAMSGVGNTVANSGMVQGANGTFYDPEYLAQNPGITGTAQGAKAAAQAASTAQNSGVGAAVDAAAKSKGILGGVKDWYGGLSMPEKVGVGIGGSLAVNQLFKPPTLVDPNVGKQTLSGPPLHNLSPDFKGTEVPQPHPYYTPQYAQGGIAALATGGMDTSSPMVAGMGNNTGFPQAHLDSTQYATPSQMPTSSAVINADYDTKTNPYTGEPVQGFASGGTTTAGGQVYYDPVKGAYYTQSDVGGFGGMLMGPNGVFGGLFNANNVPGFDQMSSDPNSMFYNGRTYLGGSPTGEDFQATQVTPDVYQQATQAATNPAVQQAVAQQLPNYSLADSLPLLQASNPGIAAMYTPKTEEVVKKAEGGIAGYNLGGYAAGGNPRLLQGPGDGVSDSIPATIGDKQPARLASGEFVVPARIVSELGNGSTDAGARELYKMMERVQAGRKKSIGKNKVAVDTKPTKHLPV